MTTSPPRLVIAVLLALVFGIVSYYASAIALQGFGEPVPSAYVPRWPSWLGGLGIGVLGILIVLRTARMSAKTWWVLLGAIPAALAIATAKSIWG